MQRSLSLFKYFSCLQYSVLLNSLLFLKNSSILKTKNYYNNNSVIIIVLLISHKLYKIDFNFVGKKKLKFKIIKY